MPSLCICYIYIYEHVLFSHKGFSNKHSRAKSKYLLLIISLLLLYIKQVRRLYLAVVEFMLHCRLLLWPIRSIFNNNLRVKTFNASPKIWSRYLDFCDQESAQNKHHTGIQTDTHGLINSKFRANREYIYSIASLKLASYIDYEKKKKVSTPPSFSGGYKN